MCEAWEEKRGSGAAGPPARGGWKHGSRHLPGEPCGGQGGDEALRPSTAAGWARPSSTLPRGIALNFQAPKPGLGGGGDADSRKAPRGQPLHSCPDPCIEDLKALSKRVRSQCTGKTPLGARRTPGCPSSAPPQAPTHLWLLPG